MIDLNVRLDSSLNEEEYRYLLHSQGKDDSALPKTLSYNFQTGKLSDYQALREFALSLLQTEEAIEFATASIIHRLFNEGYYYIELALTPYLHKNNGLSQKKILKACLRGLNDALEKCPGIDVNLVLYCSREAEEDYNIETTRLAIEYRYERVVAVGLEGDDKDHPIGEYEKLFARCKKVNYPVVIALGNHYNSYNSILKAAQIGAKRIISPYKLEYHKETFQILLERNVYYEFNPSLDVVKGSLTKYEDFPLKDLWMEGFKAYVAGNSYSIIDASLVKEFIHLGQHVNFTRDDVYHSLYISIEASFMRNLKERNRILKRVIADYDYFYNKTI